MKIDYAKYTFVSSPPPKKNRWRLALLVLIIFLSGSLIYGCWIYKHLPPDDAQGVNRVAHAIKAFFTHKIQRPKTVAASAEKEITPVKFNFYSELPSMKVAAKNPSLPVKNTPTSTPVQTTATQKYILQLAFFKDYNSASQQRLSYLLSGFETEVVQALFANEKIYRVQQGPYSTITEAKAAQKKLQKKGIEGVVKTIS